MELQSFSFGSLTIDRKTYENDIVIDRGRDSQTQEKTLETIPGHLRAHAALDRGEVSLEMPSPGDRHRSAWQAASHG
jgi:hypothetical protein